MAATTRRQAAVEAERVQVETLLKADLFGRVERGHSSRLGPVVRRDTRAARWWLRPLARRLARREAAALAALEGLPGVPRLLSWDGRVLLRTWLEGRPLHRGGPPDPDWFEAARRLVCRLHRRGVCHNDLAKEPNLLVAADGRPALIDFQLARVTRRRSRWFRLQAREDLRHLLKHKRSYAPARLRPRERRILARPSWPARLWRRSGKRLYLAVTRGLLGWADREGAGDRGGTGA
ncbi:MAG: serine/threonine protein kinase [Planctomycetota bacterium]|nr:MAG: serine/threonine protein kinase [Planctomycetota bacterium]